LVRIWKKGGALRGRGVGIAGIAASGDLLTVVMI